MTRRLFRALVVIVSTSMAGCALHGATGVGASYPAPLYQDWIHGITADHPDVQVSYEARNSEFGIKRILDGSVDFAGSDVPLTPQQRQQLKGRIVEIPTTVGAVAPIYHIEGLKVTLRFAPNTLSGIFAGAIRTWDHPAIRRDNPGAILPARRITVVHRADGSGTTRILSEALAQWDPDVWAGNVGFTVKWPANSIGATGSAGLVQAILNTPDSIGYVEYSYAVQGNIDWGYVRNSTDQFVRARLATVRAAIPTDGMPHGLLLNATSEDAYPIAALSWLLVRVPTREPARHSLCQFLYWMLDAGQKRAEPLGYAELSPALVQDARARVAEVCR
jgi:phosphate transport system substrate-binding protein